uniref:Uncharacterized protein n=1 Tax=Siphoviridae sp. ctsf32 TaxID=2827594 RepID=A0A8S5LNC2_9CAUD|nr:MAG TPA: hypothetical protein [Siphoviridae sp. ctsf32]
MLVYIYDTTKEPFKTKLKKQLKNEYIKRSRPYLIGVYFLFVYPCGGGHISDCIYLCF